ncbi:hypothetical protein [Pseudodesulfovibrio sp. zrk46]|uniref:hypothetical protein n=1 Tax=Pseudodesulfovibrio sp. zrk46 TaxID=2725288 RepID=UPI001449A81B|nr:hypothetical protein [Pseudodesulfovibrio sp. zrk46]QJB54989.1 hypothetical protein HFN16_00605 [Pseudodesulfovibrio sp. zrk46]
MSSYTESDLPVDVHHGEIITLADGTTVRFESNGEAKDIMVNDSFSPATTLFPGNAYTVQTAQGEYTVTCEFGDIMHIAKA